MSDNKSLPDDILGKIVEEYVNINKTLPYSDISKLRLVNKCFKEHIDSINDKTHVSLYHRVFDYLMNDSRLVLVDHDGDLFIKDVIFYIVLFRLVVINAYNDKIIYTVDIDDDQCFTFQLSECNEYDCRVLLNFNGLTMMVHVKLTHNFITENIIRDLGCFIRRIYAVNEKFPLHERKHKLAIGGYRHYTFMNKIKTQFFTLLTRKVFGKIIKKINTIVINCPENEFKKAVIKHMRFDLNVIEYIETYERNREQGSIVSIVSPLIKKEIFRNYTNLCCIGHFDMCILLAIENILNNRQDELERIPLIQLLTDIGALIVALDNNPVLQELLFYSRYNFIFRTTVTFMNMNNKNDKMGKIGSDISSILSIFSKIEIVHGTLEVIGINRYRSDLKFYFKYNNDYYRLLF